MNKALVVLAMLFAVSLADGMSAPDFCWKNSYGRGVGVPVSTCRSDQDKDGALCYPKCSTGMYGVGPVCWTRCDDGYTDDGALCRRNADIYGKGCCCTLFGCCHNCKSGYTDDGCTCRKDVHIYAKKSSGRGAGYPMSCTADQDSNAGLCYKRCNSGFVGVGPVCWAGCPAGWTDCGAGCAPDKHGCGDKIIDMVTQTGMAVATTVGMVVGAGEAGKAAQTVAKVAKYAAKSTKFAAKIAKYGNDIFNSAKAKGQPITQAQASDLASQTVGQFIAGVGEKGQEGWEAAFDAIAQVDPTGIMAATKTFINPLCSQIH